jgi:recombination protein RecA
VDLGVTHEIVQKSGSWYSYNGERIGQGKDNVRNFLKERPEVADAIEAKVREKAFAGLATAASRGPAVPDEVGEAEF